MIVSNYYFLSISLFLAVTCTSKASDDVMKQFIEDTTKRANSAKTVRYTLSGQREHKLVFTDKFELVVPTLDEARPELLKSIFTIDFVKKRFIHESTLIRFDADAGRMVTTSRTEAYDGKQFQTTRTESDFLGPNLSIDKADLTITLGAIEQGHIEPMYEPLFAAHGAFATVNRPLRVDSIPAAPGADDFVYLGSLMHKNYRCTIFHTEPTNTVPGLYDEFWLNPERAHSLVRKVNFSDKNPFYRIDVISKDVSGQWLPESWTTTWTTANKVTIIERFRVDAIEQDIIVPEGLFTLPIKPGMFIAAYQYPEPRKGYDTRKPALTNYRIESSGKWTKLDGHGYTTYTGELSEHVVVPPGAVRSFRWLYISIFFASVLLLFGAIHFRRRRRRRNATNLSVSSFVSPDSHRS